MNETIKVNMWMELIEWIVLTFLKVRGRPEVPAAAIIWRAEKRLSEIGQKNAVSRISTGNITIHMISRKYREKNPYVAFLSCTQPLKSFIWGQIECANWFLTAFKLHTNPFTWRSLTVNIQNKRCCWINRRIVPSIRVAPLHHWMKKATKPFEKGLCTQTKRSV